jgi:hypothetical protein
VTVTREVYWDITNIGAMYVLFALAAVTFLYGFSHAAPWWTHLVTAPILIAAAPTPANMKRAPRPGDAALPHASPRLDLMVNTNAKRCIDEGEARMIVAMNKNANAPIFQATHDGIVGDLFEIVPKLTMQAKARARSADPEAKSRAVITRLLHSPRL